MPETWFGLLLVVIGALLTIGSAMITGHKIELLLAYCWRRWPIGLGPVLGFVAGAAIVYSWIG